MVFVRNYLRYHVNDALLQRDGIPYPSLLSLAITICIGLCAVACVYIFIFFEEVCQAYKEINTKTAVIEIESVKIIKLPPPPESRSQKQQKARLEAYKALLSDLSPNLMVNTDDESSGEDTVVVNEKHSTEVAKKQLNKVAQSSFVEAIDPNDNLTIQCMVDQAVVEKDNMLYEYVSYQALATTDNEAGVLVGDQATNDIDNEVSDSFETCFENLTEDLTLNASSLEAIQCLRQQMESVD